MKKIITYLLIFWFWYNPLRALTLFSDCWLDTPDGYSICNYVDFNEDGIVNFIDYAVLVEE